jgi:hypothetical protein
MNDLIIHVTPAFQEGMQHAVQLKKLTQEKPSNNRQRRDNWRKQQERAHKWTAAMKQALGRKDA